jgi:hypothetical protein
MSALRPLITALLLLFCLAPLGSSLDMVLCFGVDGHIALEPVHDGAHPASSPTAQRSRCDRTAPMFAGMERHGPCIDVAFLASDEDGQLLPASETRPKPEVPKVVPVLFVVPASIDLPAPSILSPFSLPPYHTLTALRSMVLRI